MCSADEATCHELEVLSRASSASAVHKEAAGAVWTVQLHPGESITAVLPVRKTHRSRDVHAADASRGIDVAPGVITVCSAIGESKGVNEEQKDEECWHLLTAGAVVTSPIPDFPMPFHVITLVCTALAFLLGSIINTVFKEPKVAIAKQGDKE